MDIRAFTGSVQAFGQLSVHQGGDFEDEVYRSLKASGCVDMERLRDMIIQDHAIANEEAAALEDIAMSSKGRLAMYEGEAAQLSLFAMSRHHVVDANGHVRPDVAQSVRRVLEDVPDALTAFIQGDHGDYGANDIMPQPRALTLEQMAFEFLNDETGNENTRLQPDNVPWTPVAWRAPVIGEIGGTVLSKATRAYPFIDPQGCLYHQLNDEMDKIAEKVMVCYNVTRGFKCRRPHPWQLQMYMAGMAGHCARNYFNRRGGQYFDGAKPTDADYVES